MLCTRKPLPLTQYRVSQSLGYRPARVVGIVRTSYPLICGSSRNVPAPWMSRIPPPLPGVAPPDRPSSRPAWHGRADLSAWPLRPGQIEYSPRAASARRPSTMVSGRPAMALRRARLPGGGAHRPPARRPLRCDAARAALLTAVTRRRRVTKTRLLIASQSAVSRALPP